MPIRLYLTLVLMVITFGLGCLAGDTIPADELAKHAGEVVSVSGLVADVHTTRAGNIYLNFGQSYPNQVFTAVIFASNVKLFPNVQQWQGKKVIVTGKVTLYKGKPEIILEDPKQIRAAEKE